MVLGHRTEACIASAIYMRGREMHKFLFYVKKNFVSLKK